MIQSITMIVLFIFEAITVWQYFNSVFVFKGNKRRRLYCFIGGYVLLFSLDFIGSVVINLCVYTIINILILYLNYELRIKTALFHSVMITAFMFISEIMIVMLSRYFYRESFDLTTRNDIFIINAVLSKLMFFIICKAVSKAASKQKNYERKERGFFLLSVLPIATLVVLFDIYSISIYTPNYNLQTAIGSVLLLFANVIVFGVNESVVKTNRQITILQLANQKQEIDHEYYKILRTQYDDSRMLIHDIRNHLGMVKTFLQNEDFQKAEHYIDSISKTYNVFNRVPISENKMLDVICNHVLQKCKSKGIHLEIQNENIDLKFINDVDLCSILTNILDNAVEASEKSIDKKINLSFFRQNNAFIVISLVNSCGEPPIVENHKFISTKKEKENHGIGLMSVQRAIEKYDGQSDYYYDRKSHTFHTNIIFNIKKY